MLVIPFSLKTGAKGLSNLVLMANKSPNGIQNGLFRKISLKIWILPHFLTFYFTNTKKIANFHLLPTSFEYHVLPHCTNHRKQGKKSNILMNMTTGFMNVREGTQHFQIISQVTLQIFFKQKKCSF